MTKRRGLSACAVLLCGVGVVSAAPLAPAAHVLPHKAQTRAERLHAVEGQLTKAGSAQAASLREKAEALRLSGLKGGTRLLLAEAETALEKHDFQSAERNVTTALSLQDDQPVLRRQRAGVRLAAGDFDGAVEDLGVCLNADDGDTSAWNMLIDAELQRHQPTKAWDALQSLKLHDPTMPGLDKLQETVLKQRDGQPD
nr:hypothetical protein [uncultured Neokomagataea sp.]